MEKERDDLERLIRSQEKFEEISGKIEQIKVSEQKEK